MIITRMDIRSQIYPIVRDYCTKNPGGASLGCIIDKVLEKGQYTRKPVQLAVEEIMAESVKREWAKRYAEGVWNRGRNPWPQNFPEISSTPTGRIIRIEGDITSGTIKEVIV